ncbi:MAG: hypothetical protein J5618_03165 [Bacilli bacterium]|nr:hypothetical protein [Bacilli bacterium]
MKRKTKIGTVLCCSTALLTILGGYLLSNNTGLFNWNNQIIKNDNAHAGGELQTSETVENMSVALMNKSTNQDGSISYVYTFTVTPETSTRKDISGVLSFVDGTQGVEDYLSFSIDQTNHTFTIVKKADFAHQARLVLSCNADPSVKATINLDCKQYFKGYSNVSEKTYKQILSNEDSVLIDSIKSDGATEINASNFSTVYTIATYTGHRVEEISATVTGYLTGDDIDNMSDSGLTITNNYALSEINFTNNFTLEDLQDVVYADSALMPGTDALTFSQSDYFGVAYDITMVYNTASVLKTYTAHMIAVASTDDLDFGVPTGLTVESNNVVFENITTTVRFVYTDSSNNVTYIDPTIANGTGWYSTGSRPFYNGYINDEETRTLDGVTIDGPTLLYSINDGKGYFTGNDYSNYYIVYNAGGREMVRWVSQKCKFNDNLYGITNYASSTY